MSDPLSPSPEICQHIAQYLSDQGYCILESAMPKSITDMLYQRITTMRKEDFFQAGIGRKNNFQVDQQYRTDHIHWLHQDQASEAAYLAWMESLRLGLNQALFMGLFDYEAHFSHYAKSDFYKRHLDAFKGNTNRILTTLFYLNPQWDKQDGGELLMYENDKSQIPLHTIMPNMGTLVIFLSDQFPHEVLAAQQDRYSIAGWFRVKATGGVLDPAY
ncbi:MAG: 2OG-Fe(II) oxygenase [Mariprofundaceae bacterium]|nr:2OG-Fe(II) oxygenase [Mariprofundaceae bacterium]